MRSGARACVHARSRSAAAAARFILQAPSRENRKPLGFTTPHNQRLL